MRQAYTSVERTEYQIPEQKHEAAAHVFRAKLEKAAIYIYEGKEKILTGKYVYPERLKAVY